MAAVAVDGLLQAVQEIIAVLRPLPVPGLPLGRAVERGHPAGAVIEPVGLIPLPVTLHGLPAVPVVGILPASGGILLPEPAPEPVVTAQQFPAVRIDSAAGIGRHPLVAVAGQVPFPVLFPGEPAHGIPGETFLCPLPFRDLLPAQDKVVADVIGKFPYPAAVIADRCQVPGAVITVFCLQPFRPDLFHKILQNNRSD